MKARSDINEHVPEQVIINQIMIMIQAMAVLEAPSFDSKLLQAHAAVKAIFDQD